MGISKIKKTSLKILLATILCLIALSTTSRANNRDIPLREIFSKSQNEPGEAFYFFIPQIADDQKQYTYVYDTKLGGKHIVLPQKLMEEGWGQKNFPLGKEIVDRDTSLPGGYIPEPWHYRFYGDGRNLPYVGSYF